MPVNPTRQPLLLRMPVPSPSCDLYYLTNQICFGIFHAPPALFNDFLKWLIELRKALYLLSAVTQVTTQEQPNGGDA